MTQTQQVELMIAPVNTVIARDGRPIQTGRPMKSLPWLFPSVAVGSFRTLLGKRVPTGTSVADLPARLKSVAFRGVLPVIEDQLYLPAPADAVVKAAVNKSPRPVVALRPASLREGEFLNFPDGASALMPTQLPESETEDFKPDKKPAWWSVEKLAEWLLDPRDSKFQVPAAQDLANGRAKDGFWSGPLFDERMHVSIEPNSGVAAEARLYKTVSLALPENVSLSARVGHDESDSELVSIAAKLDDLHPLGGDRKLARWTTVNGGQVDGWQCPKNLRAKLGDTKRIRMVLATPALFAGGWKPAWLNDDLEGTPPTASNDLKLKLVGVSTERWVPVSGFSLENGHLGPKVIRRLVPAGGVYFFEVVQGTAETLVDCWLESVCDQEQDRLDGFGLAVWGIW
ncbi:MAG: type III-B CRISPR module-associated protein Cmr3 [Candidatus Sumerlaeaceae bacterium]|nr:type III-B CRISPR module-associated protein Cmr3 [Candidatus Sumerlaeaceae bacterium]